MNKRQSGAAFVRWCAKWLEVQGWRVTVYGHPGKFVAKGRYISQHQDILGCDLIAIKPKRRLHIQATLDSGIQKRLDEFQKHFAGGLLSGEDVQVWMKTPSGVKNIHGIIIVDGQAFDSTIGKIVRGKFIAVKKEEKYEY